MALEFSFYHLHGVVTPGVQVKVHDDPHVKDVGGSVEEGGPQDPFWDPRDRHCPRKKVMP